MPMTIGITVEVDAGEAWEELGYECHPDDRPEIVRNGGDITVRASVWPDEVMPHISDEDLLAECEERGLAPASAIRDQQFAEACVCLMRGDTHTGLALLGRILPPSAVSRLDLTLARMAS